MATNDSYPEPLKDALRDALQKGLEKAGVELEDGAKVSLSNDTFGEDKLRLQPTD